MNTITAITHCSKYAHEPHLVIAIDGVPLDVILSTAYPDLELKGLIPTLLDCLYDQRERQVVWERILPPLGQSAFAPILMCPDDADLSCTTVVAEVVATPTMVRWLRIGVDASKGSSHPSDIGSVVDWLTSIGPYDFQRLEYERCLDEFRALESGSETAAGNTQSAAEVADKLPKPSDGVRRIMSTPKTYGAFCLSVAFWAVASGGYAWAYHVKGRTGLAGVGLTVAGLLVVLGLFIFNLGADIPNNSEAVAGGRRFAFIMLAAGLVCGLLSLIFYI